MRRRLISYLSSLNVDNMTPIIIANYTNFGSANIFKNTLENYTGYSSNADFLMLYLILTSSNNSSNYVNLASDFEFCYRRFPTSENAGTVGSITPINDGYEGQYTFLSLPCARVALETNISYNVNISLVRYIYFLKDGRVYTPAYGNDLSNSYSNQNVVYRLK